MQRQTKRALLIVGIFVAAIGGAGALSQLKPPPERDDAENVDPLVEVLALVAGEQQFSIASQGTVRPRTETILSAEISGAVMEISPKFVAGGVFSAGETLLRIDATNYEVAVDRAEAALALRQIEFDGAEKLRSQGYRAESEYASAAAALAAAKADLVNARRNLERTRISLPYDGMVRSKDADLGQYVNPGTRLGVTFSTDVAEVRLPLTDQDLAFVNLPGADDIRLSGDDDGPHVELSAVQQGEPRTWQARIVRTEGVVDEQNRVTYAVAQVDDPYRLSANGGHETALPMGTFVAARVEGDTVSDVVRIPRTALRANNRLVFVDEDDRIRMGNVDVIRADADYAYLRADSLPADRISMTIIESAINGMTVRTTDALDNASRQGASRMPVVEGPRE